MHEGSDLSQSSWRSAFYDWAPVVGVAAVSQAGIGLEHPWTGTNLELALTGLATALPLGWRRRRPIPVAALVGLALIVQVLVVGGSLHFGSFCSAVIAMYSLSRHTANRRLAVAGGLLLGAEIATATAEQLSATPDEVVFPLFYFVGTWLLGRGMRTLHERADQLRLLNEALERDRESQAQLAAANERMRLARELHDVVAHTVMLMVVQAEAAEETIDSDPEASRRSLGAVQNAGRRGMDDLRNLVGVLREPHSSDDADALPRLDDLEPLCRWMGESGLTVHLMRDGDLDAPAPSVQESAFRIVQEALTNVLKHSTAQTATVEISSDVGRLSLVVSDPGPGRTDARGDGGHGLAGIRERIELHDGQFVAGPHGAGYRVAVEFPVREVVP